MFLGLYLTACVLLVAAGLAKGIRPHDTARAVAAIISSRSLDRTAALVRVFSLIEVGLGTAAIAHPVRGLAGAVAASYVAFSAFVFVARARGGPLATCGCFGEPDTPPTMLHLVVNLCLAASAAEFAVGARNGSLVHILGGQYGAGLPMLTACLVCAWLIHLVLSPLARLSGIRAAVGGRSRR